MSNWLMKVIKAEAERLIELAAQDHELRADLRALAESILAATTAPELKTETTPVTSPSEAVTADTGRTEEPRIELTLGRRSPAQGSSRPLPQALNQSKANHQDLIEFESRSRRKGDAALRAAERLRRAREGNVYQVDNAPPDSMNVEWAERLIDSFYWLQSSPDSAPADISLFDNVGGCFEAVAEALALVRVMLEEHPGNQKVLERPMSFVAEAQSALRGAFQRLGATADPDQLEIFEWLKVTAARYHVYIKRFMRADEVADPAGWYDLLGRIESAAAMSKQHRLPVSQVDRIRDRLERVQSDLSCDENWVALINVVDEIVRDGVPPSNREIHELLRSVIDDFPALDEIPSGFRLVLREIDRFLATRSAPSKSMVTHEPSAELMQAARLLDGKSIVLIGGNRRREAQESLRKALRLNDLIWIETKEHQAVDAFEPLIARGDVALVLLAIRWSSHAFGDVKQICDRHGKLLVRLPGGYNPNQVAAQVLAQSSTQLSSDLGRQAPRES